MALSPRHSRVLRAQGFAVVSPSDTWVINHGFGTTDLLIDVFIDFEGSRTKILPLDIISTDDDTVEVTFSSPHTGSVSILAQAEVNSN